MTLRIVVVGAGIGGLSSAIRLARQGCAVTVVEARSSAGGLAAGFELEGFRFDAGPYVLLDRPGLEWALRQLGIDPAAELAMQRIPTVYQVDDGSRHKVTIYDSFDKTASEFEQCWPGSRTCWCSRRCCQLVQQPPALHLVLTRLNQLATARSVESHRGRRRQHTLH